MKHIVAVITLLVLASAGTAAAQDATLERVQNLAATGRFTEARNTLAQWERQFADPASTATSADRARAIYLRGMLATDAKEAEETYLSLVISYPSSDVAPHALLRLGQGLLASGEPRRAVAYLVRLRTDYPRSSARDTGWLWLARAQLAAGAPAAACTAARDGLAATRAENLRVLLELEHDRACTGNANTATATTPPANTTPPVQPPSAPPVQPTGAPVQQPTTTPRPSTKAQFTVQAGAFRERASAQSSAAQLRAKGFDARVVTTEGSVLYRVRFGFFDTNIEAASAARRARLAGFDVMVVSDVAVERTI